MFNMELDFVLETNLLDDGSGQPNTPRISDANEPCLHVITM